MTLYAVLKPSPNRPVFDRAIRFPTPRDGGCLRNPDRRTRHRSRPKGLARESRPEMPRSSVVGVLQEFLHDAGAALVLPDETLEPHRQPLALPDGRGTTSGKAHRRPAYRAKLATWGCQSKTVRCSRHASSRRIDGGAYRGEQSLDWFSRVARWIISHLGDVPFLLSPARLAPAGSAG